MWTCAYVADSDQYILLCILVRVCGDLQRDIRLAGNPDIRVIRPESWLPMADPVMTDRSANAKAGLYCRLTNMKFAGFCVSQFSCTIDALTDFVSFFVLSYVFILFAKTIA